MLPLQSIGEDLIEGGARMPASFSSRIISMI
jgi:hypothetical protein